MGKSKKEMNRVLGEVNEELISFLNACRNYRTRPNEVTYSYLQRNKSSHAKRAENNKSAEKVSSSKT